MDTLYGILSIIAGFTIIWVVFTVLTVWTEEKSWRNAAKETSLIGGVVLGAAITGFVVSGLFVWGLLQVF